MPRQSSGGVNRKPQVGSWRTGTGQYEIAHMAGERRTPVSRQSQNGCALHEYRLVSIAGFRARRDEPHAAPHYPVGAAVLVGGWWRSPAATLTVRLLHHGRSAQPIRTA